MKQAYVLIGAATGLVLFFALALLPSLLYGGYAGVMLAGGILGTPVKPTLAARLLIVFGMLLGTIGVGSLFTIIGAMIGAGTGSMLSMLVREPSWGSHRK